MTWWKRFKQIVQHDVSVVDRVQIPLYHGKITVGALIALAYVNGWIGGAFWGLLLKWIRYMVSAGMRPITAAIVAVFGTLGIIAYTLFLLLGAAEDTAH